MTDQKKSEQLDASELDHVTGGANRREHDHLTDHNWQLEIEGVTTGERASGNITMKGTKINQN